MPDRAANVPKTVLLDTTALVADRGLRGADAQTLLIECRAGRRRLVVPEVVLVEAVGRHQRDVAEAAEAAAAAIRRLRRITSSSEATLPADIDPQAEAATYDAMLRERLSEYSVVVAPVPSITHAELLRRAVDRKRPFQESGTGYRDALIWATVRQLAQHEPVAFVTNNHRDFAAGRDDRTTALHADLSADVPYDSVRIWPTVGALVADLGSPNAQVLDSLEADFSTQGKLWHALAQRFGAEADGMDFGSAVEVQPTYTVLEAVVLGVFDVHGITLSSVTAMDPGAVLVGGQRASRSAINECRGVRVGCSS